VRRRCPGFRDARVLWRASHNVLLDAPVESMEQILSWISQSETSRAAVMGGREDE
jgi:hypothetical protein